jgi:hypothetical protein
VRVITFADEIRVRPAAALRAYDVESAEEYLARRERESDNQLIWQACGEVEDEGPEF